MSKNELKLQTSPADSSSVKLGFMKISKTVLKNGLKVVLLPRQDALSATVMVMVAAGSNYETRAESGIAHFLEHMCFKGTKRRLGPSDISAELDSLGAKYNAFTSNEYTGYYATVESKQVDKAFDVIADIYLNPQFNQVELDKERGVIFEEMNMYEDTPSQQVHDHLATLIYGDQPAGRPVIGTKETLSKINQPEVLKFWQKHYVPAATTVVVAGNFDQAKIRALIRQHFGSLPKRPVPKKLKVVEKQTKPAITLKFKESDQAHLAFGFRSKYLKHKDAYALTLLATILGGSMSSRLFKKIRDELGAAYYVWADSDLSTDHGLFVIAVGADKKRASLIAKTIMDECRILINDPLLPSELQKAKDCLTGRLTLSLESNSALAQYLAGQLTLKGEWETPSELVKKIKAVSVADIKRLAKETFRNDKLNLAVIGPFKEDKEFVEVLSV